MIQQKLRIVNVVIACVSFAAAETRSECSAQPQATTGVADPGGAALQKKVIAGIQENYRRIPVARCKMELTILSPGVKRREVIRGKTANGAEFEYAVAPRTITEMELILSGNSFRVACVNQETGERSTSAMHNGIWTDYSPGRNWAARWYRRDMAGIMNYDPRNFGASGQKEIFLEELAGDRVVKHETEKTENGERLVLHMERSVPAAGVTLPYRYEFDSHRNYLPCRIVYYAPDDGKIVSVLDIEHREVTPNSAWFPKKSTRRFFADAHAETPEQEGWTQKVTIEVSEVRTDETFADTAFDIAIAPDVPLRDNTRGREPPPKD